MQQKKHIIIPTAVIVVILIAAFWWGGNSPGLHGWNIPSTAKDSNKSAQTHDPNSTARKDTTPPISTPSVTQPSAESQVPASTQTSTSTKAPTQTQGSVQAPASTSVQTTTPAVAPSHDTQVRSDDEKSDLSAKEKVSLAATIAGSTAVTTPSGNEHYSQANGMVIDQSTGKDAYLTDPVPEGKPIPIEPQKAVITEKEMTCTLSVRCDSILKNMSWLDPEKVELVPENGIIFPPTQVTFYEGESVFNVLLREMKKNKIHMEFENTPIYNSAYIEGIHNLYEFDCGELSGWMYKVNNWFPNYGCSRYQLKQGDVVEWVYTCNLGVDIGGYNATNGK